MISDEQIKALAVARGFKLTNETGDDLKPYVYEFARDMIALAQEVRPLEWRSSHAYTVFGTYYVSFRVTTETYSVWRNGDPIVDESFDTEAEAIAAANEDYRKRALSNLVHGGTND